MTKTDNQTLETMNISGKLMLVWISLLIFTLQSTHAQSIDADRMNRDINIMENILEEIFKTHWSANGNTVRVGSGTFSFGKSRDISGTYLPGYGVIFTIPGGPPAFLVMSDAEGGASGYTFQYGSGDDGEKVTEEAVVNRIKEFLRDYGSTIGQLSGGEKIMVIYDTRRGRNHPYVFRSDSDERPGRNRLPTISVVATQNDLQEFRAGDIDESRLDSRLEVSRIAPGAKEQLDLKVMANIFETAFGEQEEDAFRIRGPVNYLSLDNFGALFSFDLRYGRSSITGILNSAVVNIASPDVRKEDDRSSRITVRKKNEEETSGAEEKRKQRKEEVLKAYDDFVTDLKEYLADYGRTLGSINTDQHILVSVSLSTRIGEVPERLDMQVRKSILEQADRGEISRDRVLQEITVREY